MQNFVWKELSIVTFLWQQAGFRTKYTTHHVNTLYNMVDRNLLAPFQFYCVTDTPSGLNPDIVHIPMWSVPDVPNMDNIKKPNCYRRLKLFSKEAKQIFGERIVLLDLDVVITADITDLVNRKEDFIAWNKRGVPYQGGFLQLTAGTRTEVYEKFNPFKVKALTKQYVGSDQAWISYILPSGEATVTPADGVLSFKGNIAKDPKYRRTLPNNCKMVFFHGKPDPWDSIVWDRYSWVREHYR